MSEPSVYCSADDGSWSIWLHPCAIYKDEQWIDSYHVSVLLPKDVPNPWAETKPSTVGISFDSFEAAFAHVSRPDLMVWALTVHAIELSNAVVYWRRRTEDVDPMFRKFRALEYLDDIRCAILDTGWPLGDDSDPEMTPVRLVKEILAAKETAEKAGETRFRDAVVSFLTDEIKQYARRKREAPLSLSLADSCANTAKLHIRGVVRDLLLTEKGSTPEQLSVARARSTYHLETE